jgi:integrase
MPTCGGPPAPLGDSEVLGLGLGPHSEDWLPHWAVAHSIQVCPLPNAASGTQRRGWNSARAAYVKNGESRSVPMNEVLTATLQAVRMSVSVAGPVFRARTGELYRSFRTALMRAVRQTGVLNFTFYDLHHTFASRLVMSGVNLPTVQALIGHEDISRTLRYTHLSSDHKQRAGHILESFAENPPQFSLQERGKGTVILHKALKN